MTTSDLLLSPNFHASEFRCKDGSSTEMDCGLIAMLQAIRSHFDLPIIITSGYRSPAYNSKVGGAPNSQHLYGKAADFKVKGVSIEEVHAWCNMAFPNAGLGIYVRNGSWGWIHIDNRGHRARWAG